MPTPKLPGLDGDELARFEGFLAVADPTLQAWIFANEDCDGSDFADLIADIRAFHGLDVLERHDGVIVTDNEIDA